MSANSASASINSLEQTCSRISVSELQRKNMLISLFKTRNFFYNNSNFLILLDVSIRARRRKRNVLKTNQTSLLPSGPGRTHGQITNPELELPVSLSRDPSASVAEEEVGLRLSPVSTRAADVTSQPSKQLLINHVFFVCFGCFGPAGGGSDVRIYYSYARVRCKIF